MGIHQKCREFVFLTENFALKNSRLMKNPWLKKNPLLSMWLSGANAVAGTARGRVMAESRRQMATLMTQGTKQMMEFWGGTLPPQKKKRKKQR